MSFEYHRALHSTIGLDFYPEQGLRVNKENLIHHLGLSSNRDAPLVHEFNIDDGDPVQEYLEDVHAQGFYSALLFRGGPIETMGSTPVVYLMENSDIHKKIIFDEFGKLIGVSRNGRPDYDLNGHREVRIYSRPRSQAVNLEGFDNFQGSLNVTLGGGFKAQLDSIKLNGAEGISYGFTTVLSFDDYGSRAVSGTELGLEHVPLVSTNFSFGSGDLEATKQELVIDSSEASEVAEQIMDRFVANYRNAIHLLTSSLLEIRPAIGAYQLEGLYSVNNDGCLSIGLIDFDGLEVFEDQDIPLGSKERLVRGQLKLASKPSVMTTEQRLDELKMHVHEVRNELCRLSAILDPESVLNIAINALSELGDSQLLENMRQKNGLAKILNSVELPWELDETGSVKSFSTQKSLVVNVVILGHDLCFAFEGNNLINHSDSFGELQAIIKKLGIKYMPRASYYAARDGD